jgi:tRNA (guanosine-2'-O-)-methyltransferase
VKNKKKELIAFLSNLISENRRKKFDEVLNYRTKHISVVLEDIYQSHNASAVLRSCDIFGIQNIHVIENRNTYTINPDVALGSAKWLSLHKYKKNDNNTLICLNNLKEKGYKIVATSPYEKYSTLDELSIKQPLALVFGTELTGISDTAINNADEFVRIPMYGFTESFNISVCAALCLHTLVNKLHKSDINWKISEDEKDEIVLQWLKTSIKKSDIIEKEFLSKM